MPVLFDWGYFSDHENSFPQELLDKLVKRANLPGYLGNCHSSGTVILDQLGEEHMKTGKPIFYTSADSVFQIACHEETFGPDKLYELCEIAREELTEGGYNIGRVIARPFIGDKAGNFQRTGNRHDLAVEPPAPTVLQNSSTRKTVTWFPWVKSRTFTPTAALPKGQSDRSGCAVRRHHQRDERSGR